MLALGAPMERSHPRGIAFRLEVQVMNHVFMNRIIWLRARVVAFIIGLSVCSGAAGAADKMSIRLNWIPGAQHGFLYITKEKGWDSEAGIDLENVARQVSSLVGKAIGNGDHQIRNAQCASIAPRLRA